MSLLLDNSACDAPRKLLDTPFGPGTWVSLSTFLETFLPPLPASVDFDAMIRRLKRQRASSQQIITKSGRLWGYSRKKPTDLGRSDAFKYMYTCANRITKFVHGASPRYRLHHNEQNAWYPCERSDDSLPDAYLCHAEDDGCSPTWSTIALSGAYSLSDSAEAGVNVCLLHCARLDCSYESRCRTCEKLPGQWPTVCSRTPADGLHTDIRSNVPK